MATDLCLHVAVLTADPARHAELAARVTELGHLIVSADEADVVLADANVALPDRPLVVLGGSIDSEHAGVLVFDADAIEIDAALRAVAAGLTVRPSASSEHAFAALEEQEQTVLLTPRELEVLVCLSEGLSNKAVARRLDISQHTVKFHVESIFRKLAVTTRAEAVAKGLRRGLVNL